ncbi:MAG: GntR family transcriptional regulator, partial [Planctomycetes bacterium]|nr:GntR family transcriptional regulator [Planctomycetota bacterium]
MPKEKKNIAHQRIKALLIDSFSAMELGDKLRSDRDLAEDLGVAYLTINRVMRELEWEGYVERRPRRGTFLASRERTVTKDQDTGLSRGKCVLFAHPDFYSYSYWIRMKKAEENAVKRGLGFLEYRINPGTDYTGIADIVKQRDDIMGVVLFPLPESLDKPTLNMLNAMGVPVVLLSPVSNIEKSCKNIFTVCPDWYKAGYEMLDRLYSKG